MFGTRHYRTIMVNNRAIGELAYLTSGARRGDIAAYLYPAGCLGCALHLGTFAPQQEDSAEEKIRLEHGRLEPQHKEGS